MIHQSHTCIIVSFEVRFGHSPNQLCCTASACTRDTWFNPTWSSFSPLVSVCCCPCSAIATPSRPQQDCTSKSAKLPCAAWHSYFWRWQLTSSHSMPRPRPQFAIRMAISSRYEWQQLTWVASCILSLRPGVASSVTPLLLQLCG